MKIFFGITILILASIQAMTAERDSAFAPEGKVLIHLIERTLYSTDGSASQYGMVLNRAYLGYEYKFHPKWTAGVIIDAGRPTVFGNLVVNDSSGIRHNSEYNYNEGSYYTMILKFAYVQFKPADNLALCAGSIKQIHYCVQENYWGYRYIYETLTDKFFGIPTADVGVSGSYSPATYLDIDGIVSNGTGYKQSADDKGRIKIGGAVSFKPITGFNARIYYDFTHVGDTALTGNQQLISMFIGFEAKNVLRVGAEYDIHRNHDFTMDKNLFGYSIFGSFTLGTNLEAFVRFDQISSNTLNGSKDEWNLNKNGNTYIAGLHFNPVKGFSFSLSYQGWQTEIQENNLINTGALCLEYKL